MEPNSKKFKYIFNRFLAVGGMAAIVGVIATSPDFATNVIAQDIGLYSAIIASLGICGAAWTFATQEDLKSGRTITNELKDVKDSLTNVLGKFREEFDDEFGTNQGLDDKITKIPSPSKSKVIIKSIKP
ncbi:hypothetical protein GW796_09505 [archaeon]|nr:hypothetical protein [archaeon]